MRKYRTRFWVTLSLFILPLVCVLIIYNIYSVNALNRHVAENSQSASFLYARPFSESLHSIQSYLVNELANNGDMLRLNYPLEPLTAYLCGYDIASDFSRMLATNIDGLVALSFYSEKNDLTRISYAASTGYSSPLETRIRTQVTADMKQEDSIERGWYTAEIGGHYFLIRIFRYGSVTVSAVLDFDSMLKPQDEGGSDSAYLVYATREGAVLTADPFVKENGIELELTDRQYYITGHGRSRFLVVSYELADMDLVQYYITPYGGIWNYMDVLQWLLLFLSLACLVMIPISYLYMQRLFITPLEGLKKTMEDISEGNLDAHADETNDIEEFQLMAVTFNHMMEQINQLKIAAYEKERQIQDAQIQYLQIQIRPHFFLNCLKNFYGLAEQKKYRTIQEMTVALSGYLRKIFSRDSQLIPLRDEIESVEYYIKLSKMSMSVPISCNISVDKELEDFHVLPLSILTFVENSVKYGMQSNKDLLINIRVTCLASQSAGSYVSITILDNGEGFEESLLKQLNSEAVPVQDSAHIGIQNVKKRLMLLYNGQASILYSNFNGACIEMYLPYGKQEKNS